VAGLRRRRHQLDLDAATVLGSLVADRAPLQKLRQVRRHAHGTGDPLWQECDDYDTFHDYQYPYYLHDYDYYTYHDYVDYNYSLYHHHNDTYLHHYHYDSYHYYQHPYDHYFYRYDFCQYR